MRGSEVRRMKEIRVGVIGAGRIGRIHTENLARRVDGARAVAVCDPLIASAAEWLSELGIEQTYADYRELLGRDDIDAVYICSPTDTHTQIVADAAEAGKHILCEKPIDLSVRKVKETLETVRQAGVSMQVGFNRRFDRNFATIEREVANGRVGKVHIVKITSRDPEPPPLSYVKSSGGLFLDMTIHDFDMAEFVSGNRVETVSAAGAVLIDPEIGAAGDIDTAVVTLRFENGALCVIDNSRKAAYGYDQRVEVFGSEGMICAENETPDSLRRFTANAEERSKPHWFFLERYAEAYVEESRAFVEALRTGTDVPVGGDAGLRAIVIASAANKSLAEGRPVSIDEIMAPGSASADPV